MVASVFDYPGMAIIADDLIHYFGMRAVLRRVSADGQPPVDRPVTIAIIEYKPREKPNELTNPDDRSVVMSPLDPTTGLQLAIPPDNEQDVLVTFVQPLSNPPIQKELLRLTCTPKQTAPADVNCLWEFTVR